MKTLPENRKVRKDDSPSCCVARCVYFRAAGGGSACQSVGPIIEWPGAAPGAAESVPTDAQYRMTPRRSTLSPAASSAQPHAQPSRKLSPATRSAQPHARPSRTLSPAASSAQPHARPSRTLGPAARSAQPQAQPSRTLSPAARSAQLQAQPSRTLGPEAISVQQHHSGTRCELQWRLAGVRCCAQALQYASAPAWYCSQCLEPLCAIPSDSQRQNCN